MLSIHVSAIQDSRGHFCLFISRTESISFKTEVSVAQELKLPGELKRSWRMCARPELDSAILSAIRGKKLSEYSEYELHGEFYKLTDVVIYWQPGFHFSQETLPSYQLWEHTLHHFGFYGEQETKPELVVDRRFFSQRLNHRIHR